MVFGVGSGTFGSTPPSGLTGPVYHTLTAPVNNLTDYQVEFNGFLMGNGTQFRLPIGGIDFLDMAPVKTMDVQRIWADGSFSGPDYSDVLLPSLQTKIQGATLAAFQANVTAYRDAFSPQTQAVPLWVKLPGQPLMGILAKVNQRTVPIDERWLRAGYTVASVQFRCTDPTWQGIARQVILQASGAGVSGLVFPMFNLAAGGYTVGTGVADFGSTSVVPSSSTIWNVGNSPSWPVVSVVGPSSGFTLTMNGAPVTFTGTLAATDSLSIDYSTGLATLNGTADRTYLLTSRQFTSVPANGQASLFFSATSGICTVTNADIWR